MKRYENNNRGFTLMEVLLSMVILAILVVPALSCYVSAARVNQHAGTYQKAADLGRNLMEALKNENLEKTAIMFDNPTAGFTLLRSNLTGASDSYQINGGYGELIRQAAGSYRNVTCADTDCSVKFDGSTYSFFPPTDRTSFYFGIQNISDGESSYDALITFDADVYRQPLKYKDHVNNYTMPDLKQLSQNNVTLLDNENSTDIQALEEFKNIWLSYQIYQANQNNTKVPVCPETEIKNSISKKIKINIQKDIPRNIIWINCSTEYTSSMDLNNDGNTESVNYTLQNENSKISKEDKCDREICLFYTPSEFQHDDEIAVESTDAKVKLMIAKQEGSSSTKKAIISKLDQNATTDIYTNMTGSDLESGTSKDNIKEFNLISKNDAKDRIYKVSIGIYKAGSNFSDDYASFTSTLE